MHIFDSLLLCATMIVYPAMFVALSTTAAPAAQAAGLITAQAEPAPPAPEPASQPAEKKIDLEDMMVELAELRAQVLEMQQTLDTWFETTLGELKAENEALRRELRELYRKTGGAAPAVPAPQSGLLQDVLAEPELVDGGQAKPAAPQVDPEVAKAVEDNGYLTVTEWGLSPEESKNSDPPRASLKGLIGVVLPGMSNDELEALGRQLRNEADGYDNINIEIFDDRAAAQAYKEGQSVDPEHRVLSVSRYEASGRDVILLMTGEEAVEVPREAKE